MLLFALTLSHKWTSGFSDNFIIGGLLPYKDAKNYYYGASLILNGLPLENSGQATERPLFPGFLSSLLYLTDWNLKVSLAIITQLTGIGIYLAARQILKNTNVLASSVFCAFMYFYIQPLTGYSLSESLGFLLGCFAFILIWNSACSYKRSDLILGLFVLVLAVSARAGAFIVFPLIAVWGGWVFRHKNRFSYKAAFFIFIFFLTGYIIVNSFYPRLLEIPPGSAFGNFSYAIYGQVHGGTGWHSAIEDLATRDPSIVYRASLDFFLRHPFSLLIGFVKSYRDFFLVGNSSIFPFRFDDWGDWHSVVVWSITMIFLVRGIVRSVNKYQTALSLLILAGFAGIFLSIPFLPPIDGGSRFYASTMPFFFAVIAVGVEKKVEESVSDTGPDNDMRKELILSKCIVVALVCLVVAFPPALYFFSSKPVSQVNIPCVSEQVPFTMKIHVGSYIDLIKDGTGQCGFVPSVCLGDFNENNSEKVTDDFYQFILKSANNTENNIKLVPALDMIGGKFHYFFVSHDMLSVILTRGVISGCAVEVKTKNQSIYQVESFMSNDTKLYYPAK